MIRTTRPLKPLRPLGFGRPRRTTTALLAGAVSLGGGLLAAVTVIAATPATAVVRPPSLNEADRARAYLLRTFTANRATLDGSVLTELVYGLAATDAAPADVAPVVTDLATATTAYVGAPDSLNAARAGKVLVAVGAARGDTHSFAGRDLDAELRAAVQPTGQVGATNTSNFGQALAILGLSRTSPGVPAAAVDYLARFQCPGGSFRFSGACATDPSSIDVDTTALAEQALRAGGRPADGTKADKAVAALLTAQQSGGGFATGTTGTVNANSTGLAGQALRDGGRGPEAQKAAEVVRGLQKSGGDADGAIAFTATSDGGLLLATTQGVLTLGSPSYARLVLPAVTGRACAEGTGVTVVVDLTEFRDEVLVRCAAGAPGTGYDTLDAVYDVTGRPSAQFGRSVCAIEGLPAKATTDNCFPDNGYWVYFFGTRGGPWTVSDVGADGRTPPQGSVEGWRWTPDFDATLPPRAGTTFTSDETPAPAASTSPPAGATTSPPASSSPPAAGTTTMSPSPSLPGNPCRVVIFRGGRKGAYPPRCVPAPAAQTPCTVAFSNSGRKGVLPKGCLPVPASETLCTPVTRANGRLGVVPRGCLPVRAALNSGRG